MSTYGLLNLFIAHICFGDGYIDAAWYLGNDIEIGIFEFEYMVCAEHVFIYRCFSVTVCFIYATYSGSTCNILLNLI